jgi:hypothetical protein
VLLATALGGFVLVLACIVIFCLLAATTDASPRTFMATIANDGDQVFYDAIVESKPCIISDSLKNWGKQTRLIVRNGANPVLSRNGLWLFFEREGETGGEVWRHEIASGREDRVFAGRFSASFHDVNSNGSQVIAGVRNDGIGGYSFEYFLVNVGRTDGGTFVGDDACFVRGDGIVYRTAGIDGLWLREADGATRQVAPEGFLRGSSHDGQRILYISDITKEFNERKWQVYDFNSNEFFPVPPTGSATLTPDGTTVIYVEEPYPTPQMARLSLTLGSTKGPRPDARLYCRLAFRTWWRFRRCLRGTDNAKCCFDI